MSSPFFCIPSHAFSTLQRVLPVWLLIIVAFHSAQAQGDRKNRKPEIVGQRDLSMQEGGSITIGFLDLDVKDRDDWFYPWGFTMTIYEGKNYVADESTVTPDEDFEGELKVKISVNDGKDDSNIFDLKIQVIGSNDPPIIVGQKDLKINEDESIHFGLKDLVIHDPDNAETELSISISAGEHYTIDKDRIVPETDFSGSLSVAVTVSDGEFASETFDVKITVNPVNDPPVITGHQALSTTSTIPLSLSLDHFTVTDPDNNYPEGFSLNVFNGSNYTVSATTITPDAGFEGDLKVAVRVSDGEMDSNPFTITISVRKGNRAPVITSQHPIVINEDESIGLTFDHLVVDDPDSQYPVGYTLMISPGINYSVSGKTITPIANYSGSLTVPVVVNDGKTNSEPFNLQISVLPVNDPPLLSITDQDSIVVTRGQRPITFLSHVDISDVDNEDMTLGEVGFSAGQYRQGEDFLHFNNTSNIKGFFDIKNGVLALIGRASVGEYEQALASVRVEFTGDALGTTPVKTVSVFINDGQNNSNRVTRQIQVTERGTPQFVIPTGFTPNGDFVNDTWSVRPAVEGEQIRDATVRVYTRSGLLVFESKNLSKEWDGRFNGTLLPADVYYYTIEVKSPEAVPSMKGIVTILR